MTPKRNRDFPRRDFDKPMDASIFDAPTPGERSHLQWPEERAGKENRFFRWLHRETNFCLDFHGDPARASLTVFSDGNHHMALRDCLALFQEQNAGMSGIFYATTPPGPIVKMVQSGGLRLGNLTLSASPHVFISPPEILEGLAAEGFMRNHRPWVRSRGNVILVRKGNPKRISSAADLARRDVRLFFSNPETERVSFKNYYATLKALGSGECGGREFPDDKIGRGEVLFGRCIHHREAPQALAEGAADAALIFYHLALRYLRIFPELFDAVPLGGTLKNPKPSRGNQIGRTHLGLVGDGGAWGAKLISFLRSPKALEIYRYHGLLPLPSP